MSQPYQPQPGYYPPPATQTNGMAIAALITAFLFSPAGIVLGIVARKQIRRTGEQGWGMATAGLIIGVVLTVLWVLAVVLWVVLVVWLYREVGNLPTPTPR
ncbi:hypothetical protein ADK67_10765 [Saccharothrix sp. NRRL B-16348]|uniref:DUF4190 domain-containing protein n=1 Tax=Saccharothrix sp. NRRL B-16348 TaxID=1415542 RepID=UPI0006AF35DB|nr:DUF4190 domain-containing protein [Saccharothrix sp. NRRL B-16348]KOX29416.1 hypothetical protein ADK67_10765 [Saccharothrix sp. NRRL B-16348]